MSCRRLRRHPATWISGLAGCPGVRSKPLGPRVIAETVLQVSVLIQLAHERHGLIARAESPLDRDALLFLAGHDVERESRGKLLRQRVFRRRPQRASMLALRLLLHLLGVAGAADPRAHILRRPRWRCSRTARARTSPSSARIPLIERPESIQVIAFWNRSCLREGGVTGYRIPAIEGTT